MKKIIKRQIKRKPSKLIFLTGIIIALLFVLQIINFNRYATWGEKLKTLENQERILKIENERLEKEITEASSLSSVKKRAESLGFRKASSYLYLTSEIPVALK
jgi:cell division protein FtsL